MKSQSSLTQLCTFSWIGVAALLILVATVSSAENCENFSGKFEYKDQGEKVETKCKFLAEDFSFDELKKKCNKVIIVENCPTLCNEACAEACENFEGVFEYGSGKGGDKDTKKISCQELEGQSKKKKKNKCKKEEVLANCPGVCIDTCPFPKFSCVNFVGDFKFKSGKGGKGEEKTTNCDKIASKEDANNIANKCKKKEISVNCPQVCDKERCADEE